MTSPIFILVFENVEVPGELQNQTGYVPRSPARISMGIALVLQTNLGIINYLTTSNLPHDEHIVSLHQIRSSLILFIRILQCSVGTSCKFVVVVVVGFVHTYSLVFGAVINTVAFQFHFVMLTVVFRVLTLSLASLLNALISSRSLGGDMLRWFHVAYTVMGSTPRGSLISSFSFVCCSLS